MKRSAIIFLSLLLANCRAAFDKDKIMEHIPDNVLMTWDKCNQEFNKSFDDWDAIEDPSEVPEDFLCIMQCIFKEIEAIDADGKLNIEKVVEIGNQFIVTEPEAVAGFVECLNNLDKPFTNCNDTKYK